METTSFYPVKCFFFQLPVLDTPVPVLASYHKNNKKLSLELPPQRMELDPKNIRMLNLTLNTINWAGSKCIVYIH